MKYQELYRDDFVERMENKYQKRIDARKMRSRARKLKINLANLAYK